MASCARGLAGSPAGPLLVCRCARRLICILLLLLCCATSSGQEIPAHNLGSDALVQMLAHLRTTARLLHTTAHPDDDDGSMLVYETRGEGADTMMLTLNRGEGGQNKLGAVLFDELGILRTLELLEADRYYGVEQRFTRVADFGFSKTSEETFQKWGGHDAALGDMVRVIRTFRPDVIVSRFQGSPRDGHGHHQAAGILSREAFRAAADPQRFAEQIREGLLPWQAKKLYIDNVRADEDYTLKLDAGTYDPVLGMSFAQFAIDGLRHQMSQGVGGWYIPPGHVYRYYKLIDSVLPSSAGKETSFFDGIDTTLPGLASRLGGEEPRVPFLRPALVKIEKLVDEAAAAVKPTDPSPAATPLLRGFNDLYALTQQINATEISPAAKTDLLLDLRAKEFQFLDAANLALGLEVDASVDPEQQQSFMGFLRQEQTFQMAVPGQTFTVTVHFYNRGRQTVATEDFGVHAPPPWKVEYLKSSGLGALAPNEEAWAQYRVTIPPDAGYTRPYWHRASPQQNVYAIDEPHASQPLPYAQWPVESQWQLPGSLATYDTLPLPPWPLYAGAGYRLGTKQTGENGGMINSVVRVKFIDPTYGQSQRPLAVGPPLSVQVDPPVQVVSTRTDGPVQVTVGVRNDVDGPARGSLRLEAPAGWRIAPASQAAEFTANDEYRHFTFRVQPSKLREQVYTVRAALDYEGKPYTEGFELLGRNDIGWFYYYRPAVQRISAVDVAVPPGLRIGYIMGAGDDIPAVLRQLGMRVEMISPADLAGGDLSRFHTIVLGIRAYDVRTDLRAYNRRLLEYVARGGTLVVQYNASVNVFNQGHYTPYPATLSNERVTVEEAPVKVLDPANPIFHYPNLITGRDFDGWVQERGLYFMRSWDPQFKPLLASSDPGEPPREGGLLVARYGKGLYIYTGYAFFRQVPAGVPGAIRLFVNLLSADAISAWRGSPTRVHGSKTRATPAPPVAHGKR